MRNSPRPQSSETVPRLASSRAGPGVSTTSLVGAEADDMGIPPTDVEVKIAELAAKIDRLTDLVLVLQEQSTAKVGLA